MILSRSFSLFLVYAFLVALPGISYSQDVNKDTLLKEAIDKLRNKEPAPFYSPGKNPVKEAAQGAREKLISAGERAIALLKAEVADLIESHKTDDIFLQEVAALAWDIGGEQEIDYILSLWRRIPADRQRNAVYHTAIKAAAKKNARVVPLLKFCLSNHDGSFYSPEREIDIRWPLTVKMIWAAYGPSGWPILEEFLRTSNDNKGRQSAILILTQAQYLPALPAIRECAESSNEFLHQSAILSLGTFGHPDDFDRLITGLENADGEELWSRAYALFEYEDLRGAAALAPRLDCQDAEARAEVIAALTHLLTMDSIAALNVFCGKKHDKRETRICNRFSINFQKDFESTLQKFTTLPPKEQTQKISVVREKLDARYKPSPNGKKLTRDDFMVLQKSWMDDGPFFPSGYESITIGDLLSMSTPEDISLYYKAIAGQYEHLTEQSWGDIFTLEDIVKRIGRSRYRQEISISSKVQSP